MFGRFTDEKWGKRDETEQFGAIMVDAEKHGKQAGTAAPAMGSIMPIICQ